MPLPTGTVTFLFTDIGDSTPKWERMPRQMHEAVAEHDRILREAVEAHGGSVFKTVGDAVCAAFDRPHLAVEAAVEAQKRLRDHDWGEVGAIEVRMGIHTGEAEVRDEDYFGTTLSRVARLTSVAHPGQILLSQATAELVESGGDGPVRLIPLGTVPLKGLTRPEHVLQLVHPDLPHDFPPPPTGSNPNNLPAELSLFVGRESELQDLLTAMRRSRLVSVTGAGGSGKTRLAIEAGRESDVRYRDGIWLVELAPVVDPDAVPGEVAAALSIRPEPGVPILTTLVRDLKARNLLVILDNCEHLLDACAHLVQRLLQAAPEVHVLATSREALGVPGETAIRLPSMSVPDEDGCRTIDDLRRYDASSLFLQRAAEANSAFAPEGAACATVAQICRRLDGIPLALELAASRLRSMPLAQLSERLDDRFRILTGGSRTAVSRQRTLRALIDWSYDLLTPEEQAVLRSLAVFPDGWTIEAAEKVAAGNGVEGWEVLDLLSSLVEKSLVMCSTTADGGGRYRMLETIRQYAWDKANDLGESEAIRDRLLTYYADFGRNIPNLPAGTAMTTVFAEWENIRAAVEWAISTRNAFGLTVLKHVSDLFEGRYRHREDMELAERALEACGDVDDAETQGRIYFHISNIALRQLNNEKLEKYAQMAIDFFRASGEEVGAALAEIPLVTLDSYRGDFERARQRLQRLLAEASRLHHPTLLAKTHYRAMLLEREVGDVEAMEILLEPTMRFFAETENPQWLCWTRSYKGWIAEARGQLGEAALIYGASMKRFIEYENLLGTVWQWECIARVCSLAERYDACAKLYGAAAEERNRIRWPLQENEVPRNEAAATRAREAMSGSYEECFAEGRRMSRDEAIAFAMLEVEALQVS